MAKRNLSLGRGDRGACEGIRKQDGSGGGVGNRNTPSQPKKKGK